MKMTRTTQRRNEGGRYSAKNASDWYAEIEAQHIARIEAEQTAKDDAARALTTALAHQVGNAVAALPEAASRIAKAATLVQAGQVWPLTSGNFLVGSQTDAKAAHLVTRGPWTCDCTHAHYRGSLCSHILAVQLTIRIGAAYQPSYELAQQAA